MRHTWRPKNPAEQRHHFLYTCPCVCTRTFLHYRISYESHRITSTPRCGVRVSSDSLRGFSRHQPLHLPLFSCTLPPFTAKEFHIAPPESLINLTECEINWKCIWKKGKNLVCRHFCLLINIINNQSLRFMEFPSQLSISVAINYADIWISFVFFMFVHLFVQIEIISS